MGSYEPLEQCCWVTLVTGASYMPGVMILAHTLDKHKSEYPLIVQYTSSLGEEAIATLEAEARRAQRIIPIHVELLLPRAGQINVGSVAERFKDTYTKLRAFEVYKQGYTKACFLDADMAMFQNPDDIFNIELPGRDWLGATHGCVCNLDRDPWADKTWVKGNCPFTTLSSPDQVVSAILPDCRPTYRLLNGGTFLFYPSENLWENLLSSFNTSDNLKKYQFPDQDFLKDFYWDKWQPISWKYNAIKTMKYWHPEMWSDDKVTVLHYIVDKPWERKVSPDGVAGYLGRDGETHQWWWNLYEEWLSNKQKFDPVVLQTMSKYVDTKAPFTEVIPLPEPPGKPEDVLPFP